MSEQDQSKPAGFRGTGGYAPIPKRTSKLKTAEEAFAAVTDGTVLGMTCTHWNSVALGAVRQIIRQGTKNLTILPTPSAGIAIDMLIAAGAVKKTLVSYIGLETHGLAPNFRRAVENGEIEAADVDEISLVYGYRAGAGGVPFAVLPPYYKLMDLPELNPEYFQEIPDPFGGKNAFAFKALKPDVAVIHVAQCDEYGNARQLAGHHTETLMAKAAKHVIITAEEIVPHETVTADPTGTTIPSVLVHSVVRMPYGCHPGACPARYSPDHENLADYAALAREGRTAEYLQKYVHDCADHNAYLDLIGASRLINLNLY